MYRMSVFHCEHMTMHAVTFSYLQIQKTQQRKLQRNHLRVMVILMVMKMTIVKQLPFTYDICYLRETTGNVHPTGTECAIKYIYHIEYMSNRSNQSPTVGPYARPSLQFSYDIS